MIPQRQSGLGRGLGAIIPPKPPVAPPAPVTSPAAPVADEKPVTPESVAPSMVEEVETTAVGSSSLGLKEVALDSIERNPYQPRTHFDHNELEELIKSIEEHGMLQPLVVSPLPQGRYQLIAGERRFRALGILGRTRVPVIVRDASEQQKLEFAIIENVQRQELNAIEEAKAYIRLSEEFGLTQDQIAERVGKSRSQVANTIRLLQLPKEIQDGLMEKKISASNARTILSLPNDHERLKLYYAMIANNFTVRQTEERVAAPRQALNKDPNVTDFEDRMRAWLRCRVIVKEGAKGTGEIKIKYSSPEEFKTLIEKLGDKQAGE